MFLIYKRRKRILIAGLFLIVIMAFVFLFSAVSSVYAQSEADNMLWGGYENEIQEKTGLGNTDPRILIARIIRYALGFLGIIAVVIIMYAGWLWMTSEGDPEKIGRAKKVLTNAVIGLFIILASFGIVSFILNKLLEASGVGGPGTGPGPGGPGPGFGVLGSCTVESVYPEPNQKEVPRNTAIIVTFKEEVASSTVCVENSGDNVLCNCNPSGDCDKIISDNIKIFYTIERSSCLGAGPCNTQVTDVRAISNDFKTFVFSPVNYLGSPSEYIWHTVYLNNNIEKVDSSGGLGGGIFDTCRSDYLEWQFEVSNKIDLTPPQVENSGVFPAPDNVRDTVNTTPAVQATGDITVNSQPQPDTSATMGAPAGSYNATIDNFNTNHQQDGELMFAINADGVTAVLQNNTTGMLLGTAQTSNGSITFSGLFTLSLDNYPTDDFTVGSSWTIQVTSFIQGDTLTVGSIVYTFVSGAPSGNEIQVGGSIAGNIVNILNSRPDLIATVAGNTVNLTAEVAGSAGNNIFLSTGNTSALSITPMSGGIDGGETVTINDISDKPRNAVIQVNFNEAINPTTVSGDADDIYNYIKVFLAGGADAGAVCADNSDCRSYQCSSNNCVNNYIAGKFEVSNQYKTVEFISNDLCGVNGCGEQIYCLPENSNLRVELIAANLEGCAGNDDCVTKTPYTICNSYCQNSSNENYPLSIIPFDGIMDTALNSLDGNRDDDADGPLNFYDENNPDPLDGDNYQWSFWINDVIDLTPPVIDVAAPANNDADIDLADPITIDFSKVMMSSSLRTGSTNIFNGQDYFEHKLLNIWNFSGSALGYWITKNNIDDSLPLDGEADWTRAQINHSIFADSTSYRAQAGSGVKDIYQNCFKPSSSATCVGNPSCCGEAPNIGSSCP